MGEFLNRPVRPADSRGAAADWTIILRRSASCFSSC